MKEFLIEVGALALFLVACGAPRAPTADPAQVQASAVSAAHTMVALTLAAVPTTPPSATAPARPTAAPLPTFDASLQLPTMAVPTATPAGGETDCRHTLDVGAAGPTHRTLIRNQSDAILTLSLSLYKPNQFGQCGWISYANLKRSGTVMANLPAGYWSAFAWASGKGKNFTVSGSFYVQPAQFDKLELCIRPNVDKYAPQC